MSKFLTNIKNVLGYPALVVDEMANALAGYTPPTSAPPRAATSRDLYLSIKDGHELSAMKILQERSEAKDKFPLNNDFLALAAQNGMKTVMRELVTNHGVDPNTRYSGHYRGNLTPLHVAVMNNDIETATELLALGADSGAVISKNNMEALGLSLYKNKDNAASVNGNFSGAKIYAEWKGILGTQIPLSPVDMAVLSGQDKMIDAMVTAGVNLESPNAAKYTPISVAAESGLSKPVALLQAYGVKGGVNGFNQDRIDADSSPASGSKNARLNAPKPLSNG